MNKTIYGIAALLVIFIGLFVYSVINKPLLPQPDNATFHQEKRIVQPFTMVNHQGNAFNEQSLQGKWSWIFLGYTSCPDICPTTLQVLNFAYNDLQAIAPSQVILVSVDPLRDTQERLSKYIHYFNDDFIALRAEHDVLFPFARDIGLLYAISNETDFAVQAGHYLVDHSASLVLINPEGKIAATISPHFEQGQPPSIDQQSLISDFAKIVKLSQ